MTVSLLGFAGVTAAALLGLLGVLRSGRAPAHLADVEGLARLVDELQEERDGWRQRAEECERRERRERRAGGHGA